MNIYFAGAIAGTKPNQKQIHQQIVSICEELGHTVVSRRHAYQVGKENIEPSDVFHRDLWWLMRKSDIVISELSLASYGLGFEMSLASVMGLPILGLVQEDSSPSNFVFGNTFDNYQYKKYNHKNLHQEISSWIDSLDIFAQKRRGLYIAFEGLNQSGKSTQIKLLIEKLRQHKLPVWQCREPGGTWLAEQIRSLVQIQTEEEPTLQTDTTLYMSQRAQLVNKEIKPRLIDNQIVVSDRSDGTSLAFQGFGRGQNILRVAALNGFAVNNIHPDIVIYLDISDDEIIRRGKITQEEFDRNEHENQDFHQLCRQGYEEALRLDQLSPPPTWFRVDAVGKPEEIHQKIWQIIKLSAKYPLNT